MDSYVAVKFEFFLKISPSHRFLVMFIQCASAAELFYARKAGLTDLEEKLAELDAGCFKL